MAANISTLQDASWQDKAYIGIKNTDASSPTFKYFAGLTQEIDLPDISKDFEGQPVMNGGRIRENSAEEDLEFTMTIYPIGVLTGDGSTRPEGVAEWFLPDTVSSRTQAYEPSLERHDFDVAILWTNVEDSENSTSPVEADSEIDTSSGGETKAALRWVFKNCQITAFNQDFGDMVHTAEVTFKLSPYDETGAANYYNESATDTSTTALSAV